MRLGLRKSALFMLAAGLLLPAARGSVYSELMAEFSRYEHRLSGSTNLDRCFKAIEDQLRAAGLDPQYQTFDTLAPRTEWCRFTVEGREVGPLHPLNGGIAPVHTDGEIAGQLVWCGDGSLEALAGKDLAGAIALLDLGAPRVALANALGLGALAGIYVGNENASQWNLGNLWQNGPVMIPQFYLDTETARQNGLMEGPPRPASVNARVTLKDAVGRSLWVLLPGEDGAKFNFAGEELLILSATLDTAGLVPDQCPQIRGAANAALLADVLCRLAAAPRKRGVLAVFFGGHLNAQEAARFFYHAVSRAETDPADKDSLEASGRQYEDELKDVENLQAECGRDDLFSTRDEAASRLTLRIKERLVGSVANLNTDIQKLRKANLSLEKQQRTLAAEKPAQPAADSPESPAKEQADLQSQIQNNDTEIKRLSAGKQVWNGLRQQITDRRLGDDAASRTAYLDVVHWVRRNLDVRRAELERAIAHNRSAAALARTIGGRTIIGHLEFNFANDRDPWLFSMLGAYELFWEKGQDVGSYLMHLAALGRIYRSVRDSAWPAPLFESALNPFYKPFSLCVPGQPSAPTAPAVLAGTLGFQLMTVGASLDDDQMPASRPCELAGLAPQMTAFIGAAADSPELSLRSPFPRPQMETRLTYRWKGPDDYDGLRFVNYSKASTDVEGPARNAVMLMRRDSGAANLAGVSRYPLSRINADGFVFVPMINRAVTAAGEGETGVFGFGYDEEGRLERYGESIGSVDVEAPRRNLFYGYGGGAFNWGFAPELLPGLTKGNLLNARTDSPNRVFCDIYFPAIHVYFTDKEGRIKRLGWNGEMLLGASAQAPRGEGIPLDGRALLGMDGIRQGAEDYWILNESRLKALRERNIVNDALESLHAESREHLDDAAAARQGRNYALARAHDIFATCLENRVYAPLRGITDDLVKAVVILLLLNIPFAFAMERLIFGFTSIYRQVVGFVGFFVGTFLILFFTHPAFALASAPVVIFLAFVIILLSAVTVSIVMGRIRHEIRAIQGLASTVHGVASDSGAGLAAVLIGISGMRNRPLKTLLTATTVMLLTFTILVFASFTAELGVVETYLGKGQDEDRIELHRFSYLDIADDTVRAVESLCGRDCRVFRRGGMFRNPAQAADRGLTTPLSPDRVLLNPATGDTAGLGAIFGLDPAETRVSAKLSDLLPHFADAAWPCPPIYLSEATAAKLNVRPGEDLRMGGRPFTYAGHFNSGALQEMTTLDNTKIVPPDFEVTMKNIEKGPGQGANVQDLEEADVGSFSWFSADRTAITDLGRLRDYFPPYVYVTFVTLYPRDAGADLAQTARALAPVFRGAAHVKTAEGVRKLFFTRAVAGSGFNDVIVPLLLGGLIIFSSLMGSIVDREREIFTYSALGLSPPDVGALFFAESSVYSVIGGMGGYLLGQVVTRLLAFLGSHGLFHPPNMNVSSLSSVSTILVVMAVVMLSTIYPAVKAGRSANPGVARKWKMPAPEGDLHRFVFPFTVSGTDFAGILSFIREHFENHSDATLGNFAARGVELFRADGGSGGGPRLGIRAEISLAPFDLGVFQNFRMYSKQFEIRGIEEVVIELERLSGAPGAWLRGNKVFVDELRQQFLLWRSLPIATVEHYRSQTDGELNPGGKVISDQ